MDSLWRLAPLSGQSTVFSPLMSCFATSVPVLDGPSLLHSQELTMALNVNRPRLLRVEQKVVLKRLAPAMALHLPQDMALLPVLLLPQDMALHLVLLPPLVMALLLVLLLPLVMALLLVLLPPQDMAPHRVLPLPQAMPLHLVLLQPLDIALLP